MNENSEFQYEKKIMGYLFKFYREQLNYQKKLPKLNEFLKKDRDYYDEYCTYCNKCSNNRLICVTATLYKIERGFPLKNDCYYIQIAKKFGKKVLFDKKVIGRLDQIVDYLFSFIVTNKKENISQLLALVTNELNVYKDVIYVSERLNLYNDLLNYFLYGVLPTKENIKLYRFLINNNIDQKHHKLILLLLFFSSVVYTENIDLLSDIVKEIKKFKDERIFFQIQLFDIRNGESINAYMRLNLINENDLSDYHKYLLRDSKAYTLMNSGDFKSAYEMMKSNSVLIENDFCDITRINYFSKLGILSFSLKEYDETVKYLNQVHLYSPNSLKTNYLLLFKALEMEKKFSEISRILEDIDVNEIINKETKTIIIYYNMKYMRGELSKEKMTKLEKYICEEMKSISSFGSFYSDILLEDLKYYVSKTLNYKMLLLFE